jgi:hypothetical protein
MLGYVMDCDLPFSLKQVRTAIEAHKNPLALTAGATQAPSITGIERFSTLHARASQSDIELRHVLVPFQAVAAASPIPGATTGVSEADNPGHTA